jgi:hypothetical protein
MRHAQMTFAGALSELSNRHEHEVAIAVNDAKAKNTRLAEECAKLQEELATLRQASSKNDQELWTSSSHGNHALVKDVAEPVILLPGATCEEGVEVIRVPEVQADSKLFKPFSVRTEETAIAPASCTEKAGLGKERRRCLFPDTEELKLQVQEAIRGKPKYSVLEFYHTTGLCQRIARSTFFENLTFGVIFAVTIWIAVDTDLNSAATLNEADWPFIVGANSFCFYFTFELLTRFGAFRRKRDCLKDASFIMDTCLVLQDVIETWLITIYVAATDSGGGTPAKLGIFRVLRMVKLFRMARAVRLMRALPEIAILVKGIGIATRSVFFTLFLLFIIIYVFAVVFRQLTDGSEIGSKYFQNVPHAINSLLLDGVLPDNAAIVNDLSEANWYLWPLIMFFILLASLTVMNMLVGVLVEVVGAVAESEKEGLAVLEMREHLVEAMAKLDIDDSKGISKSEFEKILIQPEAAKILQDIGVDVVGLVDLSDFIFEDFGDQGELDLNHFMNVVLDLRTCNTAKVKDVVMLQKLLKRDMQEFCEKVLLQCQEVLTVLPSSTLK